MRTETEPSERSAAAVPVDKSSMRVGSMFASIAGRYDLMNHLLSLNIDRLWRRFTTRTVPPEPGVPVLDCCTGTADLALAYHRATGNRELAVLARWHSALTPVMVGFGPGAGVVAIQEPRTRLTVTLPVLA